jgi:Tol biopolymer transport system component
MLSGQTPFARDTPTDTLAAIVDREPDLRALPAGTPHGIVRLLKRCLEKDPKQRLRDIADARADLADAGTVAEAPAVVARSGLRTAGSMVLGAIGGVALTATALVALPGLRSTPDDVPTLSPAVRIVSTRANEFGPALSPDGKWVAYLSNVRGPTDVWVKFVAGGDAVNLTAGSDIVVQSADFVGGLDISPDGTQIAFSAARVGEPQTAQTTWVIPAPIGGVPRPLLASGSQGMRWSPDGKRIAYVVAGGSLGDAIAVADADGQNAREIVARSAAAHMHWLRWSPDGEYIYFNFGIQNWNIEPTSIYRVRSSGGGIEPFLPATRRAAFPYPAPNGRGVFYSANPDSVELGLWWRDFGTSRDYRLTNGIGEYGAPYASADGSRLVATAVDVRQALMRVAVNGSGSTELEQITDGFSGDFDPVWTPDGSRLFFSSSRSGSRNLWSVSADFSRPTPLTSGTTFDERPIVSPDGRQVAFISEQAGRRAIFTMPAGGGTRREIVAADVLGGLSWSRDGSRIVYAAPYGDAPGLYTVSVSDGQTERLPTPGSANAPEWSPREDVIAYIEPRGGALGAQVRFVTADGGPAYTEEPDLPVQAAHGFLAWSADGRRVAVVGLPGASAGYIWLIEPGGSTPPSRLTDLPSGASLRGMTWARDGSSIIVGFVQWASDIVMFNVAEP